MSRVDQLESSAKVNEVEERSKELHCIYDVVRIITTSADLEHILQQIANVIPQAWLHSDHACARITFNGMQYVSSPVPSAVKWVQCAGILVNGEKVGTIEVFYINNFQEFDEGPFLKEERNLINGLAEIIATVITNRMAENTRKDIEVQLLHADRLASIGQLAAGIAHELNEPLGNILGFAQLAKKESGLPQQVLKDLERIETASLYARAIIKNLLTFSRQTPIQVIDININEIILKSLDLFEGRFAKEGIELQTKLAEALPLLRADPSKIMQLLTNFIINSVQAMANGGVLSIETSLVNGNICICVKDTGCGIAKEHRDKIFLPFFTTKDVTEGTGLGLAVVYGIVQAHKGSIKFSSEVNQGTTFEVFLPIDKVK